MGGLILYNHYVRDKDGNYTKVTMEEPPTQYIHIPQPQRETQAPPPPEISQTMPPPPPPSRNPPPQRPAGMQFANRILGHLNLADIDSGDLLLLILLFFLFQQKADEELLIALGFLLIL